MKRLCIVVSAIVACALSTASATMIRQEWDTGVGGSRQAIIDFLEDLANPVPPPDVEEIQDVSSYVGAKDNYVAKFYGWVTVPANGTYQFHYACDDFGMLYVSQDEEMENAVEVAWVDGWTAIAEWNKYPATQHSAPMQLRAGQVMAVMAFFQEAGGGDNMDVGWTGPGLSQDITNPTYLTDYITHIAPTPTRAKNAGPEVGATDVPPYTDLAWIPGKFAATHDVYLSTNAADVNDRSASALVSQGQTGASLDADLALGATYYWAVDEVNSAPDFTVHAGDTWSFTVEPETYAVAGVMATASSEFSADSLAANTVNGSGLTNGLHNADAGAMWLSAPGGSAWIEFDLGAPYQLASMTVWNQNQLVESIIGFSSKDIVVETSADGANWSVVEGATQLAQGPGVPAYAANNTIDMGGVTVTHVRITINSGYGPLGQVGLSEVQFNYIPVAAREPQPAAGGMTDTLDVLLAWRGGRGAVSHEVLFSGDQAAVLDGSAVVGTTTVDERSLDVSGRGLNYAGTYYWQVIEHDADGAANPGPVWSFQATSTGVIDDMEIYADEEPFEIWATWIDGFGDEANNGAIVGNGNLGERGIVSQGAQSMPIHFDNSSASVSEVTREFSPALSFTRGQPESLVLDVRGDAPAFQEDADGNIIMSAAGADIWDTADEFRFAYKMLAGDGSIIARVNSQTVVHDWSKAGVMIRESATPESANAFLPISGINGIRFQARTSTFIASVNDDAALDGVQQTVPRDQPVWLRLERSGNNFTGYYSLDETPTNWTTLGMVHTVPMVSNVLIGLAVTSHLVGSTVVANISDVSTTGNVSGGWTVEAIGGVHADGGDADSMYVRVTSGNQSRTITHPNPAITQAADWDIWTIPMTDLAGLNLNAISAITVGVGTPGGGPSGAMGTAYVDYIRVFTSSPDL